MRTHTEGSSMHSRGLEVNALDTCRLCMMTGSTNMESIFNLLSRGNADSSVAKRIAYVTQLSPVQGDSLPTKICQQCLYRLDLAEVFIRQCKQSDESLRFQLMQERVHNGGNRTDKWSAETVTPIPASGVALPSTYYPLDSRGHPFKTENSESDFIPPPLLNEQCVVVENGSESIGDAVFELKPEPSEVLIEDDDYIVDTNDSYEILQRVHQISPARVILCPFCPSAFSDEQSMEIHSRTHVNEPFLAMQADQQPDQQLLANANTASVAQKRDLIKPGSARRSVEIPRSARSSLSGSERHAHRDKARQWPEQTTGPAYQCAVCSEKFSGKNSQLRHRCRPSFCPPIAKSTIGESDAVVQPPKVTLPSMMLPGQLNQLQSGQSVVLPIIKQTFSAMKREHIRLERMKQQVREKLMPVEEREKQPVELTKLPPRPAPFTSLVCSPDLGIHTGSSAFRDEVDIKEEVVEPGFEDEMTMPVVSSPRRTGRRLLQANASAQEVAAPRSIEGSAGRVVSKPGPKRSKTNVDYNSNRDDFNKKSKMSPKRSQAKVDNNIDCAGVNKKNKPGPKQKQTDVDNNINRRYSNKKTKKVP